LIYFSAVVRAQGTSMADENEQYGEIIWQAITASPDAAVPVGRSGSHAGLGYGARLEIDSWQRAVRAGVVR